MSNNNTPHLRFPEFKRRWDEKLVKEVCEITTGKSNTQDQVSNGQYPFFIRSATPVKSNKYIYDCEAVITIGDGQIGKVFHYINGKFDLHQRCYMMYNFKDVCPRFFYYFFSANFYERAMRLTAKATVDSVRLEMISDMPIFYPIRNEQLKIASCLTEMDNLIAAQGQKVEALKEKKKGLMQQLFPQNGETTPRLRFPGFEGEWKEKKLSECFEILTNNTLSRSELNYDNGKSLNVHYGDILIKFGEILDLSKEKLPYITDDELSQKACKSILKDGDVIIADTAEDETVGKCSEIRRINKIPVVAGLHTIPIRPLFSFAEGYLGFYLNSFAYRKGLYALMQGVKVTSISRHSLRVTNIVFPPSLLEQQKIAVCLSELDNLIAVESDKLENLKNYKKGLMQQLFPQPVK